jgi:hypothetical protein
MLRAGHREVAFSASVDTRVSHCLFARSVAEELELDIELGLPSTFVTANSSIRTFGHEITISALGIEIHSTAYFFADPHINKNVLGRRGWLDRLRVGIVDHDQMIYIADYDDVNA